jgi:RAB protein geranylgeranyltransferase component A
VTIFLFFFFFFADGVSSLNTMKGIELLQRYLKSQGRYGGNTPLLYPLYGTSELCQAFCRFFFFFGDVICYLFQSSFI